MNDVLGYADVVDLHGGTLDQYNNLTWPNEKIAAGATASHQVTVKVKNPIPNTPPTNDNPNGFDLTMTNVYGNTINIKVPGTPVTTVAVATTSLPNTGPGETLLVIAIIMIGGGYFYSRARLLARESNLAIQEMSGQ